MNMGHFQSSVVLCLWLGSLAIISSHPTIVNQYYTDLMTKCSQSSRANNPSCTQMSPIAYDAYQTNDLYANYPYPASPVSAMPYANYPQFASPVSIMPYSNYPQFGSNNKLDLKKDDEQHSEFLRGIYAQILDSMKERGESRVPSSDDLRDRSVGDEDEEPSTVVPNQLQNIDPTIYRLFEATMMDILMGERDKRSYKDAANNMTNSATSSEAQNLSPDNLAYLLHPQPISFMQNIEQESFPEPAFHQSHYMMPSSAFTQPDPSPLEEVGSQSEEQLATKDDHPTNTVPNGTNSAGHDSEPQKPFPAFNSVYFNQPIPMIPVPSMQTVQQTYPPVPTFYPVKYAMPPTPYAMPGTAPTVYNSQDEASFYLQPVYTAPISAPGPPFQVWAAGGQYRPLVDSDYAKILESNTTENNLNMSGGPAETNLTKITVDPAAEKKDNLRLHPSAGGNTREGVNNKMILPHRPRTSTSKLLINPSLSGKSVRENESAAQRRYNARKLASAKRTHREQANPISYYPQPYLLPQAYASAPQYTMF